MIDLTAITQIQDRIASIEALYGPTRGRAQGEFAAALNSQLQKLAAPPEDAQQAKRKAVMNSQKNDSYNRKQNNVDSKERSVAAADTTLVHPQLQRLIQEAAKKYNLDPKLVSAIAEVESGGNQSAVSAAGAVGVMQLMPDTANGLGVNPYDTGENVEGGAKYLRELLDTFEGDLKKAIAAYNAGPNAVKIYGDVPPYPETQAYVNNVLDIYQ